MAKTFIALIFPEYPGPGNISTSSEWENDNLPNDDALRLWIKDLYSFVDFFKDEECKLMYDSSNADAAAFIMKTLPSCYPSQERRFRFALHGLENWRKNRTSQERESYLIFKENICNEIRSEIASRKKKNASDSYLITVHIPHYKPKTWTLIKNSCRINVESLPLSIKQNFKWLSHNRHPQRKYNWNPKHGENGKGAHPNNKGDKVSVLMSTREHARDLLLNAIGYENHDYLYCFDFDFKKYMEFKADCKFKNLSLGTDERLYHSYHIDDEHAIPDRIMKKIEALQDSI